MAEYHFIFNLNDHTYEARDDGLLDPEGYLLSVHRYTPEFTGFAASLNKRFDEIIMADNGFFARIRDLIAEFEIESDLLFEQVKAFEDKIERKVRPGELPETAQAAYAELGKRIRARVYEIEKAHPLDFEAVLMAQSEIRPDRVVCPEDILQAALVGLNIEPEYTSLPRSFYRYRNERSGRFYRDALDQYPGEARIIAVASAVDYNTAFDAGRELGAAGAQDLAIGTGAYMIDNHYTDHYKTGRRTIVLERSAARRYLRTVLTAKGLIEGYKEKRGAYPRSLHFLGLGTPVMMVMTAWIARDLQEVTYDATSPIKDAVEGTLYVKEPSYIKLRTDKLAEFYMQNPQESWTCDCPYCRKYLDIYEMDYARAADWFAKNPDKTNLKRDDLREGALADALPLFAMPRGGAFARDIADWRTGHNHAMLMRIMEELRAWRDEGVMEEKIAAKLDLYMRRTLPHFAYAIGEAWNISKKRG